MHDDSSLICLSNDCNLMEADNYLSPSINVPPLRFLKALFDSRHSLVRVLRFGLW